MSTTTGPVTLADVLAAQAVLDGVVRVTPLEGSRPLSDRVGGPVYLKCENLQRAGSFKIRGAYLRISRLTEEQRRHGVVAASAGNHAQGVALAASLLGTTATVFMPSGARCRSSRPPGRTAPTSTSPATPSTRRSSRRRRMPSRPVPY